MSESEGKLTALAARLAERADKQLGKEVDAAIKGVQNLSSYQETVTLNLNRGVTLKADGEVEIDVERFLYALGRKIMERLKPTRREWAYNSFLQEFDNWKSGKLALDDDD